MAPLTPQEKKWLAAISYAEGTYKPGKGPQYNIMFGGGTFSDLSKHPDQVVRSSRNASAAAGAFQFMPGTWAAVSKKIGARDFGPEAQNRAALELIRQRGVDPTRDPITPQTVAKLAPEWASLPTAKGTSYYPNQSVKRFADIQKFLGTVDAVAPVPGAAPATPGPAPAAARISLPRFDFQGALKNVLFKQALGQIGAPMTGGGTALALQEKADALRDAGQDDEAEIVESQIPSSLLSNTQTPALDPINLVKDILAIRQEANAFNTQASQIEKSLNDVATSLTAQNAGFNVVTGAKPTQGTANPGGGIGYPGAVVTSEKDVTGEPGLDFALKGGRGAMFASPFKGEILKIVRETNPSNRGPGGKGYGNYIELRGTTPEGKQFDTLIAHFDALNPNLKPGMVVEPGTVIGKQGETGRATGPHISMDFFDPGKTTASSDILRIRDIVASRIKKGLPPFG